MSMKDRITHPTVHAKHRGIKRERATNTKVYLHSIKNAGIAWIALNDEPADMDAESVSGLISVCLLADLMGTSPGYIAKEVIRFRLELKSKEE